MHAGAKDEAARAEAEVEAVLMLVETAGSLQLRADAHRCMAAARQQRLAPEAIRSAPQL